MTVPVTGINEIVLEVLDLDKAVAFYGDTLGLPLYSRSEDRAWFVDRLSGLDPEVISFEEDGRGNAVYVTDPDGNVVEFWTYDVARDAVVA